MKWNIDIELVGTNVDGQQGPARMASAKTETGNHTRYPFINVYLVWRDTVEHVRQSRSSIRVLDYHFVRRIQHGVLDGYSDSTDRSELPEVAHRPLRWFLKDLNDFRSSSTQVSINLRDDQFTTL